MPFEIVRNDIVKMQVDAIVNTANPQPIVGDGVDRAVHMAAGARLYFAASHAMCIEKLFREVAIGDFPADAVKDNPEMDRVEVPGLLERLYDTYEKEILLPEL